MPPHDIDAEEALLGLLLRDAEAAARGVELVPPNAYYAPSHGHVAAAIAAVIGRGEVPDVHTVPVELRRAGVLDSLNAADAQGHAAIVCLLARGGFASLVDHYARIINQAATARALAAKSADLAEAAYAGDLDHAARVLDDAASLVGGAGRSGDIEAELIAFDDLERRPTPSYLVDGILVENSLAGIYGPRGSGKSFLGLDIGAHVASGAWWQGKAVRRGSVLYIAAEGVGGLPKRVAAWKTYHRIHEVPDLHVYPHAVNLLDSNAIRVLAGLVARRRFCVVVVDTVARSLVGGDENSAKDVGILIESVDRIRAASDATVVLVHHTGKDSQAGMRGSSALEAALNTVLEVRGDDQNLQVHCRKQKDDAEFSPIRLSLTVVNVVVGGVATTSCAVTGRTANDWVPDSRLAQARDVLVQCMSSTGMAGTDVRSAIEERLGVKRTAAHEIRNGLVSEGFLINTGTDRRPFYVLKAEAS